MPTPFSFLAKRYSLSPRALHWATSAAVLVSILIVVAGGVVRVTGSGLGCPDWPTCTRSSLTPVPAMGIHAVIEFANRMLTSVLCAAVAWVIVAARLQKPYNRTITRLGWSQFWLVVANAVAGGITVLTKLSPYMVALHFLMAIALLTTTVLTWHKVRQTPEAGHARFPQAVRTFTYSIVALTAILVIAGTIVSGAGPHSGDSSDVTRMPVDWTVVAVVHGALGTLTLILAIAFWLYLRRLPAAAVLRLRVVTFIGVVAAQAIIGVVQSLTSLPELLVAIHLLGAALVWVGAQRVLLDGDPQLFALKNPAKFPSYTSSSEPEPSPETSGSLGPLGSHRETLGSHRETSKLVE